VVLKSSEYLEPRSSHGLHVYYFVRERKIYTSIGTSCVLFCEGTQSPFSRARPRFYGACIGSCIGNSGAGHNRNYVPVVGPIDT